MTADSRIMRDSLMQLCFTVIILIAVLTNKMIADGASSKFGGKNPPVAKKVASQPPNDFTKWQKKKPTDSVVKIKNVPTVPSKVFTKWPPKEEPAKIVVSLPPKDVTQLAEAAAVPSIPTEWTTQMTPAKRIASVSPEMTPAKLIASVSPEITTAKLIASVSPEMTPEPEAMIASVSPEMTPEPEAMIASVSPEMTPEPEAMVASVSPEITPEPEAMVASVSLEITPEPEAMVASVSPEMTPAEMIASVSPEMTPAKMIASVSPKMTPAEIIKSFPPDKDKAAANPSIPPEEKSAANPSIPPRKMLDTSSPTFEVDVGPSVPPNGEPKNLWVEMDVVPSIPPETEIETSSPEAKETITTINTGTTSTSIASLPISENHSPPPILFMELPAQSQFANVLDPAQGTLPDDNAPADFSEPVNSAQSQVANGLDGSDPATDAIQGDSAPADFSLAESEAGNGLAESNAAISKSANIDYPSYSDVKGLYAQLLGGYDTRVRPKLNQTDVTQVSVFFSLLNILEFKTAEQTFDILGYFYFVWEDEFLTWKPRHFSRIQWIKVPMPEIWTPHLTIANMYSGDSKIGDSTDRVLVTYKGKVSWVPEATYKIVCEVEIEFYPFDKQTCKMTFHVSDNMVSEVDIYANAKHNGIRTDHYIENAKWGLINASVEKYFVDDVSYMDVVFVVQRRIEFIFFSTVAPLMLVSILNVCAFLIPVESREKGEYSATIVITYGVFISHICASIPPNSTTIPYFLLYMIWMLGFSVSTVIYAIIQSRMYSHHRNRRIRIGLLTMCFGTRLKSPDVDADRKDDKVKSKIVTNIEEVTDSDNRVLLCGDFLKKLDVMMIVLYVLSIIGTTAYFFFSMNIASLF